MKSEGMNRTTQLHPAGNPVMGQPVLKRGHDHAATSEALIEEILAAAGLESLSQAKPAVAR